MKTSLKMLILLAFVTAPVAAFAADGGPTKGTKSYQSAKSNAAKMQDDAQNQQMRAENTQNPADIAPAAGASEESAPTPAKSFKEDIRLPRKN